jgi:hypothetical protein
MNDITDALNDKSTNNKLTFPQMYSQILEFEQIFTDAQTEFRFYASMLIPSDISKDKKNTYEHSLYNNQLEFSKKYLPELEKINPERTRMLYNKMYNSISDMTGRINTAYWLENLLSQENTINFLEKTLKFTDKLEHMIGEYKSNIHPEVFKELKTDITTLEGAIKHIKDSITDNHPVIKIPKN